MPSLRTSSSTRILSSPANSTAGWLASYFVLELLRRNQAERLFGELLSEDASVRARAQSTLVHCRSRVDPAALWEGVRGDSIGAGIRVELAGFILSTWPEFQGSIGDDLIRILASSDVPGRLAALEVLRRQPACAFSVLTLLRICAREETEPSVRLAVVDVLGAIATNEKGENQKVVVRVIAGFLRDREPAIRERVACMLTTSLKFGVKHAIEPILEALKVGNSDTSDAMKVVSACPNELTIVLHDVVFGKEFSPAVKQWAAGHRLGT